MSRRAGRELQVHHRARLSRDSFRRQTAEHGRLQKTLREDRTRLTLRRTCFWKGQTWPVLLFCIAVCWYPMKPERFLVLGAACKLVSAFRTRAAHVVALGPIRVQKRSPEPEPSPSRRIEAGSWLLRRKQHSRYIRI